MIDFHGPCATTNLIGVASAGLIARTAVTTRAGQSIGRSGDVVQGIPAPAFIGHFKACICETFLVAHACAHLNGVHGIFVDSVAEEARKPVAVAGAQSVVVAVGVGI